MKSIAAWEMEAVFIFTGIMILLVAGVIGYLIAVLLRKGEEKQAEKEDPCDSCLRWPECNGVDEGCPWRDEDGR